MKPHAIKRYLLSVLTFAAILPGCVLAAGSATITADGNRTQIDWKNAMIRVDPGNSADYVILRDGHVYSITTSNDQTRVMDMTGMVQMIRSLAQSSSRVPIPFDATIDAVKATGASKTIAGIKGHVYKVTLTDAKGRAQTRSLVLTSDPRVVEMTNAWLQALPPVLGDARVAQIRQALPAKDRGLLEVENDYRLVAISNTTPDTARFKLPAQAASLSDMVKMLIRRNTQQ